MDYNIFEIKQKLLSILEEVVNKNHVKIKMTHETSLLQCAMTADNDRSNLGAK